jgi:16S rRNA (guanine(527)-N(7))-methyltransferase RsmG
MTRKRQPRRGDVSGRKSKAELLLSNSNEYSKNYNSLKTRLEPFGVSLSPALADSLGRYLALLLRWNQKINLTASSDPDEILSRHIGESLFGAQFLPEAAGTLYDIGAGAGLPGLPLKLARPDWELVLVEADRRKAAFLSEAARFLNLERTRVLSNRFDQLPVDSGIADVVTARALGGYPALLEWARRALRPSGCVLLWLGARDARSVAQISGWKWDTPVLIPRSEQRIVLRGVPRPE